MPIREKNTEEFQSDQKLRDLAFIDELTNLHNRRYLYQCLPKELKDMQRLNKKLCLFMMDVDSFKEINDTYGHLCGDRVLAGIAEILQKNSREGDTVVRYAGDEFLGILPGVEEEVAIKVAGRIIDQINKTSFDAGEGKTNVHVTISIGLAFFPIDAQDPEKLIHQADQALYTSKHAGRNRVSTTKDVTKQALSDREIQEIFPCPKLVGRDNELDLLKELLNNAEKGKSGFALIKGERGVGKSRLIGELAKHAQEKGLTTITATCSPEISKQPYQIIIKALDNLFTSLGADAREFIRSLPEAQTAQLVNYIPSLKQFLPDSVKPARDSSSKQAQIDLFKGVCQSLIYIVKRNTLLLVLDDFHWIDKGALELFDHIVKDLGNIPILIVGALRHDELESREDYASLDEVIERIKKEELLSEITLTSLEKQVVLQMIMAIFSNLRVDPKFIEIIYDVSAGNPLFVEESLRSLLNKGFIFYQDKKWHSREISEAKIPAFLKGAIQRRVSMLDEETKPIIAAAAVIGEVFDFDTLCQLMEKDSGYVLEIMDRAIKQHFIMPISPFQTDTLKFNSGVIRDVIYSELDAQEKQKLHRKLAVIEESRHKDNIDSAAGSIGYHFDMAQDEQKTQYYSNMLLEKASRMPSYTDVFSYIQEALIEKVEEIIVPLSNASMKLIPPVIRALRLATQNVRLYPPQSAIRMSFVHQAHKQLGDILSKDSVLVISTVENRFLANGEEIGDKAAKEAGAGAFIALMADHRIKTITFKKGLTQENLSLFLDGFGQSFDELSDEGGLSGCLRKSNIEHVAVNEVRYAQTSQLTKKRTKFEEAMLVDYLIGKVSNLEGENSEFAVKVANDPKKLAAALKKVAEAAKKQKGKDQAQQNNIIARSLQKLSSIGQVKGGAEQYRKNVAKAMMSLDYKLRSQVLQSSIEPAKAVTNKKVQDAPGDVAKDDISDFSDADVMKMVGKEISESRGNLTNLRKLINGLSSDKQHREKLLPQIKAKLKGQGLDEDEIAYALGEHLWAGLSLEDKVQRAAKVSAQKYMRLQTEISEDTDRLLFELLEDDRYNEADAVLERLLEQLNDKSKEVRTTTISDIDKISRKLIDKEKFFLLERIVGAFSERLNQEGEPGIYSLIVQTLSGNCVSLIKANNFIQGTGILREFNLRLNSKELLDIKKQPIQEAKSKIIATAAVINPLAVMLEQKIDHRDNFYELAELIAEIGGLATMDQLFKLTISKSQYADPFRTYSLRWNVSKVFKQMGDQAVLYLKDKFNLPQVALVKTALELLGHIQNKNVVKYMRPLLKAENLEVRREAISTLGKIGSQETIELLSVATKDADKQIGLAAIRALATIGTRKVLPILRPLLKDKQFADEVKSAIRRIEKGKAKES